MRRRTICHAAAVIINLGILASCRPSDVLDVPAPTGVLPAGTQASQSGAENIAANGAAYVSQAFAQYRTGVIEWGGLLADEFRWANVRDGGQYAAVDARLTRGVRGFAEPGDAGLQALMAGRITLLTAIPLLERYEPSGGQAKIGLAFALVGYIELLAAENYCAGLPLATPTASGVAYGAPLTTDSLLGVAEAHLDSAVSYAGNDSVAAPLASVGLARTRLDRANFDGARAAAAAVPTGFVYNTELQPGGYNSGGLTTSNMYDYGVQFYGCGEAVTADRKGRNGLDYISANDPRLVFDITLAETCDGLITGAADSIWYYPVKFGNPSSAVPLATGAEARLIEAEAALRAGRTSTWAADLNALRAAAPSTYLGLASSVPPLTTDSTTGASTAARVDVTFRERAFWLYGMGSRLGDLRRLVRQYGRDQRSVFSVGPYPAGSAAGLPSPLPTYGSDVSLTLPTAAGALTDPNPSYKGCISTAA